MKREFAAILFSCVAAGSASAGEVLAQDLPPPAQNAEQDTKGLTALIRGSLNEAKMTPPLTDAAMIGADALLYSSELWLEGLPEAPGISVDAIASRFHRYPGYQPVAIPTHALPTSFELNRGHLTANFGANVTTVDTPKTVIPTQAYAGTIDPSGGTGAFSGRLEYDVSAWQVYGGTSRSLVANADGTIGFNNTLLGGTFYKLPETLLGGKIGTGFEVNPVGDAKTRLEYRQKFGTTEGFIAAERIVPYQSVPTHDSTGVNALKAGINRKF